MNFSDFQNKYLPPGQLADVFEYLRQISGVRWNKSIIGYSTRGLPIIAYELGSGQTHILIGSQIHGNEPTSTRGLLTFLQRLITSNLNLLSNLKFTIIGQLNPDGAEAYIRENANGINLNDDALDLSQLENQAFNRFIEHIQPDYYFSLHDQGTFQAAGENGPPSTMALLAPSIDEQGTINSLRQKIMQIIASISQSIDYDQSYYLSRFDDAYNPNGWGAKLTSAGVGYILFEAGFVPSDYLRIKPISLMAEALMEASNIIASNSYSQAVADDYFKLPINNREFVDLLITNVELVTVGQEGINQLPIIFKEELRNKQVIFHPNIIRTQGWSNVRGHQIIDFCQNQ